VELIRNTEKTQDNPRDNIRILITGSEGQIGTELQEILRAKYGRDNVVASDVKKRSKSADRASSGPYVYVDVLDEAAMAKIVVDYNIDWVIHNTSLLSAMGEKNPQMAMEVNIQGIQNSLEVARKYNLRIFIPSSIAAFGPTTPRDNTPDLTIMRPTTIYGVTKVYAELLGEYYHKKFGVDFRSLRYPGILSSKTLPGGGTTDYAVEIFYEALLKAKYNCFLKEDSELPMMHMPDCLKATQMLLEADPSTLTQRVYNCNGISFTPSQLASQIQKYIPQFEISYKPDFRQAIADSWPKSLDDSAARRDWGWKHDYDLDGITKDMLINLRVKLGSNPANGPLQTLANI